MVALVLLTAFLIISPAHALSMARDRLEHLGGFNAESRITARKLSKREVAQDVDDLKRSFADGLENAVKYLVDTQMEVLVHSTQKDQGDELLIYNTTKNYNTTKRCPIQAETYNTFMVLCHFPVTVMAILLPDILDNNALPENFEASVTREKLLKFQEYLSKFDEAELTKDFNSTQQRNTAMKIVSSTSAFVNSTLLMPGALRKDDIQGFVREIKPELSKAAKYAVEDYFKVLDRIIGRMNNSGSCVEVSNVSQWSIVIAVDGFSYPGSFLEKYYTQLIEREFGTTETYFPRRLAFLPEPVCNTSVGTCTDPPMFTMALSDAALVSSISQLFEITGPYPLHSLLSDAAVEILMLTPSSLDTLKGFSTFEEKLYVILIVVLFSIATVFVVVVISICSEDKVMQMASKQTKIKIEKRKKGPSLFTPISEKRFASSYTSFQKLKKRHSQEPLISNEATQQGRVKYRPSPEPGNPVTHTGLSENYTTPTMNTVTHSEITLADLTDS